MELIADILLIAGASAAAFYCIVLSRRLTRFNDLEKGVGGAIAVLSAQVDDMTKMLQSAQGTASGSTASLDGLTTRAEDVARRLELLVASMHDLPPETAAPAPPAPETAAPPVPEAVSPPVPETAPPPMPESPAAASPPEHPTPEDPPASKPATVFRSARRSIRQEAA